MDINTQLAILYVLFMAFLVVYIWQTSSFENRLSDIESLIKIRENDLKNILNAIKQLNENQSLFIKPGEPVILWRQEETFHKKEEGGK